MANEDCIKAILDAAPHLSRDEAAAIDDAVANFKRKRQAQGSLDAAGDTEEFVAKLKDDIKAAAHIEKRNQALNILREQERRAFYDANPERPSERVWAMLTGDQRTYYGAGESIGAQSNSLTETFMSDLFRDLKKTGTLEALRKRTPEFDRDVGNELAHLTAPEFGRDTGNKLAKDAAVAINRQQEKARNALNRAGAWVGKLPGWIVRQSHDSYKILKAGREEWKATVLPLLDDKFVAATGNMDEFLNGVWINLATGNHLRADQVGSAKAPAFKGPGNIGKRLSQERVLQFKNADAWFDYNEQFGSASVIEAALHGLTRSADNISMLRRFGTNPEAAFNADLDRLNIAAKKAGNTDEFNRLGSKGIRDTFDVLLGKASIAENPTLAYVGAVGRAFINMASLGGVVVSSITDFVQRAQVLRYNGVGLLSRWGQSLEGFFPSDAKREVAEAIGVGLDGMRGQIMSRFSATDNLPGKVAKIQDRFFRMTLLTQETDAQKRGVGLILANNLADHKADAWADLPALLRGNLERYSITADRWNVIRQAETMAADGRHYLTRDGVEALHDGAFEPLMTDGPLSEATRSRALAEEREATSQALQTYYIDQVNEALNMPDAYVRALTTMGTKRGTKTGEAIRFLMQFKSFSLAFATKQLARETLRRAGSGEGYGFGGKLASLDKNGLAQLIVGTTIMGYLAQTVKEIAKGKTPRDPELLSTWAAAFTQGGGAGIYGDFLMADYNRFGGGIAETLGGPAIGAGLGYLQTLQKLAQGATAKTADKREAALDAARSRGYYTTKSLIPFANLFYTKLGLDYLMLYQVQEWVSPGSLRRAEKKAQEDYGQTPIFKRPSQAIPKGGGSRIFEGIR